MGQQSSSLVEHCSRLLHARQIHLIEWPKEEIAALDQRQLNGTENEMSKQLHSIS